MLGVWFGLAGAAAVEAESTASAERPIGPEPVGLSFELRIADGRTRFVQGELIPLELVFSSADEDRYQLDAATYDRSGRMSLESFEVEPAEGVVDPLREYFASSGYRGGGMRAMPMLGPDPAVVELWANEWLRFDRPGTYRLRVRTGRVRDLSGAERLFDPSSVVELVSEPVELEIVPAEPALTDPLLAEALVDLASDDAERRRRGLAALRHLGTRASIEPLVDALAAPATRSGDSYAFDAMLGLYGHPDREAVVEELERHLVAPDGVAKPFLVTVLARLKWLVGQPPPGDDAETAAAEDTSRAGDERAGVRQLRRLYLAQLASVADRKVGPARSASLATLVESDIPRFDGPGGGLPSAATRLASVFEELPPERQLDLLRHHWPELRDPAMTPVLERTIENPPQAARLTDGELLNVAVLRLLDLEPEAARALILADMLRPAPRLAVGLLDRLGLGGLPPEIEATLVERLQAASTSRDRDKLASLLARHGSRKILCQVLELYDGPHLSDLRTCWRAPFLAYLLRVDPAVGTDRLQRALRRDASRQAPECRSDLLKDVADVAWSDALERIAIQQLDEPNPVYARYAAEALREHAGPGAEAALWRSMERWSERWSGRAEDLAQRPGRDHPFQEERRLGWEFARALRDGTGWALSRDDVERLAKLCVTEDHREQVEMDLRWLGADDEVNFTVYSVDPPRFSIGQYSADSEAALKARMLQFPAGSVFTCRFDPNAEDAVARGELLDRLEAFLTEQGMGLVRRRP